MGGGTAEMFKTETNASYFLKKFLLVLLFSCIYSLKSFNYFNQISPSLICTNKYNFDNDLPAVMVIIYSDLDEITNYISISCENVIISELINIKVDKNIINDVIILYKNFRWI